ncbi:ubiquitin carboxyl-terminal hydrolase 27 [Impatiens glandulifera]|uniref:ubiquitin carboxyl-terminal hydrolase 27 n=1 Tax=Impatiens glandulifera TaxID=253017 RepID=UPI001FB14856|nr:ubiquitin carboxyl-terminal hydrolase 27 [Impatiens glandulifera]
MKDLDIPSLIPKLNSCRNGFLTLCRQTRWVHASGFAGLVCIAGLILAFKDRSVRKFNTLNWSSSSSSVKDRSSEKPCTVPGLQNLGNNCFLNVILQALASCSYFQAFLQKTAEESESLLGDEWVERVPFIVALTSLMKELCHTEIDRKVLSPRKLMHAMDHYVSNFNLTSQQDAEEALFHVLSSLREELLGYLVGNCGSVADVVSLSNNRIISRKLLSEDSEQNEQERWRDEFRGPFDGRLGSILNCQTCSSQISLDFQFFQTLHLPLVINGASNILIGSSLEMCLKQFFEEEHLENYFCNNCWHSAAIKYLSAVDENKTDVEIVRGCIKEVSCDCKRISTLNKLPWSNNFSHASKQLSMTHGPKILCINLQRAFANRFGELVKLQGHVSFPLILNMSTFMRSGVGTQNPHEEILRNGQVEHFQSLWPILNPLKLQLSKGIRNGLNIQTGNTNPQNLISTDKFQPEARLDAASFPNRVASGPGSFASSEDKYRLVSVVEHFGRPGSGHYMVYRRVNTELNYRDPVRLLESSPACWFCISDSQVNIASEHNVLNAEASMLFYEKI